MKKAEEKGKKEKIEAIRVRIDENVMNGLKSYLEEIPHKHAKIIYAYLDKLLVRVEEENEQ